MALTTVGSDCNLGISISSVGSNTYTAQMASGKEFPIYQEDWSIKTDYYLDTFVYHLEELIAGLKNSGNPLNRVLELGVARGVLSIGIALLTDDNTKIIGVDIEEKSQKLVTKNAKLNKVAQKIETRIGDLFEPVKGEKFDLVFGEMPLQPIDAKAQETFIAQGHSSEILNISGGPDGRYFIDALIKQGSNHLNPGGALFVIQPSFVDVNKTIAMLDEHGLTGTVMVSREWLLNDTKFTRSNKSYLEKTHNHTFLKNEVGEDIFHLTIIKGIMRSS